MSSSKITRREWAALAGAAVVGSTLSTPLSTPLRAAGKLTAGDVVKRIQEKIAIPWNPKTYRDTYKMGSAEMEVKGITSTFMSTFDVLQRAAAAGNNMIITHEPTFWSDNDEVKSLTDDKLYQAKVDFGKKNNLIVFRFHDHWHARKPDGIFEGWNKALGWDKYMPDPDKREYVIPPTTLENVANHVRDTLKSGSLRVIGDPKLVVSKIARGAHTLNGNMEAMPDADMLLISEAREWDSIEYVRDVVLSGAKKGAIIVSHEAGEEAGMDQCAKWLKTFITEVPVAFVDSHDPFWRPE